MLMRDHIRESLNFHRYPRENFKLPSFFPFQPDLAKQVYNAMEYSPSASDGQEISRILCNPNVHYRVPNSPLPVRTLKHINPFHALSTYFLKINFNVTSQSTPRFSKLTLSSRFPHKNPVLISVLLQICHMTRLSPPL